LDSLLEKTSDRDFAQASRLLVKLSEASQLPSFLCIKGVTLLTNEPRCYGGFSNVYEARYQGPDSALQKVALKRLRGYHTTSEYQEFRRRFCGEALVWKNLKHPHILPFLGVDSDNFHMCIGMVSPWMENGTIRQYMEDRGHSNVNVNKCLFQVALGIKYLHSRKLVHGDLHASNILIDGEGNARLADFGLVGFAEATAGTHTSRPGGIVRFMAPELLMPERFGLDTCHRSLASDVFAFSCVCIEVHTGSRPFSEIPTLAVLLKILEGERPNRPRDTPGISDFLWKIMEQCWNTQPSDRPSIKDVVQSMEENNFGFP